MSLGGMYLKPLIAEDRAEEKIAPEAMAFKVQHVGQYAPHDLAKKAGVVAGDIVVEYDGRADFRRETDLLAYALNQRPPGVTVPLVVLRGGERVTLSVPTSR